MHGVLREGLLEGRMVALTGPVRPEIAGLVADLGARTSTLEPDLADEAATEQAARALDAVNALVVDGAALFGAADTSGDELAGLRAAADGAWAAVRAVANAAWIERSAPGKVVLVAPAPQDGPHADATAAAYENLARTTSIEWARYGIKPTAITPATTPVEDVATVVAYVLSTAGDYFSGTRLSLT